MTLSITHFITERGLDCFNVAQQFTKTDYLICIFDCNLLLVFLSVVNRFNQYYDIPINRNYQKQL